MTELENKIYDIVRSIPRGQVMTYGQVAEKAGDKNADPERKSPPQQQKEAARHDREKQSRRQLVEDYTAVIVRIEAYGTVYRRQQKRVSPDIDKLILHVVTEI